jgi:hypothetical protein
VVSRYIFHQLATYKAIKPTHPQNNFRQPVAHVPHSVNDPAQRVSLPDKTQRVLARLGTFSRVGHNFLKMAQLSAARPAFRPNPFPRGPLKNLPSLLHYHHITVSVECTSLSYTDAIFLKKNYRPLEWPAFGRNCPPPIPLVFPP